MATEMENSSDKPSVWPFWILTILYVIGAVFFWLSNSKSFEGINPDSWGDFLSGVFSPLAFLWLLYAALAQRAELQLQRKEIREGNKTQKQQQAQLERQANALDAQVMRIKAQASAQFQPVFVLDTSSGHDAGAQIHIKNLGSSVLDVLGLDGVDAQSVINPSGGLHCHVRGGVWAYWERGYSLIFFIPNAVIEASGGMEGLIFSVQFTRLDLEKFVFKIRLLMSEQRIVLDSVEELVP